MLVHDGASDFYAVVLERNAGKIALHQITGGSWGAALDSAAATINDSTAYTIRVERKQRHLEAWVVGQANAVIEYDSSDDFGVGQSGFYSDKTGVTFDDLAAWVGASHDPVTRRLAGPVSASIASGKLAIASGTRGGEVVLQGFTDDNYMVQYTPGAPGSTLG